MTYVLIGLFALGAVVSLYKAIFEPEEYEKAVRKNCEFYGNIGGALIRGFLGRR